MYQRVRTIRNTCVVVAALITVAAGQAGAAGSDPVKCRRAINLESSKFQRDKIKRLKKCEDRSQNGKAPADVAACFADATTRIDAAAGKLQTAIAKACCGKNKICNPADTGDNADLAPATIFWTNRVTVCSSGNRAGLICQQNSDCVGTCIGGNPAGGAFADCTTNAQCGGGVCTGGFNCALPTSGPDYCPNLESGKLPNYTAPVGGPVMSGIACGTCRFGDADGQDCRISADCGTACEGGPDDGTTCAVASDCQTFCATGANAGLACTVPTVTVDCGLSCVSGSNAGLACTVPTQAVDCPGSTCGATLCATSSCRSGVCNPGLTVSGPADVANCLACFGEASVDQAIGIGYDGLNPFDSSKGNGAKLKACKRAIGNELKKFYDKKINLLRICQDKSIKGPAIVCPDAVAGPLIAAAQAKLIAKISDPATGKCKDFSVSQIGAPVTCPAVKIPGGSSCAAPINNPVDLANCLACVAEYKVDCANALGATFASPATNELPDECNPICGNGKLESGETCDDGNLLDGDACPSDCTIAPCSAPFGSVTASVTFTPPNSLVKPFPAIDLSAMTLYIQYPENKVRIPGQGSDQSVQDAINVPSGATFTPNDLNYALNILVNQPDLSVIPAPDAFDITFQTCNLAAAPVDGDFRCLFRDGADTTGKAVYGGTCTVDVP